MAMTDSRSLRDIDDLRLGRNLRALWQAVHGPEYDGGDITLHIGVGEAQPTVRVWHHESNAMVQSHDLDAVMRTVAAHVAQFVVENSMEEPKSKKERGKAG